MDGGGRGFAEEELTAQETALYDRQIRVWGVDAQKRLSKAHVLVCGMNGTTIEFCKNIVLAGVGSLSFMDDHIVTDDDLNANFLIPPDESIYGGRSRAEVCCESLKDFNPMVRVAVEKGDPSLIDGEFLDKFDIIVVSCASLKTKLLINDNCRKRNKHIAFYAIECKDSCGEIFVDLQNHSYLQKKPGGEAEQQELTYLSLQEAISVPWKDLPKKTTKLYFAMRVLEKYELSEERSPGETSLSDLPAVLARRKDMCDSMSLNESQIPTALLERLLAAGKKEHPPVCAILGGILGQLLGTQNVRVVVHGTPLFLPNSTAMVYHVPRVVPESMNPVRGVLWTYGESGNYDIDEDESDGSVPTLPQQSFIFSSLVGASCIHFGMANA